jgi:hypothetical protein
MVVRTQRHGRIDNYHRSETTVQGLLERLTGNGLDTLVSMNKSESVSNMCRST